MNEWLIGGLAIVITLCGGAWKLVQDQVKHQREIQELTEKYQNQILTNYKEEVTKTEVRMIEQTRYLDANMQRAINDLKLRTDKLENAK